MSSIVPSDTPSEEDPESGQPEPYRFRSKRQERIFNRLKKLVSSGVADFYYDACRLVDETVPFASVTHLVSHLLREIEGAIRGVLTTTITGASTRFESGEAEGEENHKATIRGILDSLAISSDEGVGKAWLDFAGRLQKFAHRPGLAQPRSFDQEFKGHWEGMEKVLDEVLDQFESHYNRVFNQLDRLLQIGCPTIKDTKYLIHNIPNNEVAHRYFFGELSSPGWINPLRSRGAFEHPPDSGHWPESKYLVRMAQTHLDEEHIIQAIDATIRSIPETPNEWIHSDLTECALRMSAYLAISWAS